MSDQRYEAETAVISLHLCKKHDSRVKTDIVIKLDRFNIKFRKVQFLKTHTMLNLLFFHRSF